MIFKTGSNLRGRLLAAAAVVCFAIALAFNSTPAQRREPQVYGTFDGDPMYTVGPAGIIPAILNPQFLSGQEAAAQMSPDEPVMGMVINGEARAYSLWHLDAHEIVNDRIAGTAIAVTW